MTTDPHPSHALEAAARRRRELRDALFALEESISSPVRTPENWRLDVASHLESLQHAFADHVAETEGPGGLYEEVEDVAVNAAPKARRLREEHPPLAAAIAAAVTRFETEFPADADLEQARDDVQRLMGRIVRHRQHGADLVWEAYAIDIGTAG